MKPPISVRKLTDDWLEYPDWMARDPCARLLNALKRHVRDGRAVARACWCETPVSCHRLLIGLEMDHRGLVGEVL
jgi:hypothetical protein